VDVALIVKDQENNTFKDTQFPAKVVWAIFGICLLPFGLNLLGVDFGSRMVPFDLDGLLPQQAVDVLHQTLRGSFTHTLLEWTAFLIAVFTALLAFIHFNIKRDITTPIIGLALLSAGCMDAFHTLAANRLIPAVADNQNLIPFTWAICRFFNALIMISGVGIFLMRGQRKMLSGTGFIMVVSVIFGGLAYGIIHVCAISAKLPQTMFPDSIVTRPWDVAALILFLAAGIFFYPKFYKMAPSLFSYALIISVVPEVMTQLHMAFGSTELFDNHFNIAHFLKIIAYLVPLIGLLMDYILTYRDEEEQSAEKIKTLAKLPSQNPDPVIRISKEGLLLLCINTIPKRRNDCCRRRDMQRAFGSVCLK